MIERRENIRNLIDKSTKLEYDDRYKLISKGFGPVFRPNKCGRRVLWIDMNCYSKENSSRLNEFKKNLPNYPFYLFTSVLKAFEFLSKIKFELVYVS